METVTFLGTRKIQVGKNASLSPGQSCVLQVILADPEHRSPPCVGDGFVHVLVCIPEPQEVLQLPQELQPPFTEK